MYGQIMIFAWRHKYDAIGDMGRGWARIGKSVTSYKSSHGESKALNYIIGSFVVFSY